MEKLKPSKTLTARTALALSCVAFGGSFVSCGDDWQEPIRVPAGAVDLGLTNDYQTRSFKVDRGDPDKVDCGESSLNGDHNKFKEDFPLSEEKVQVDCHGTGEDYPVVYVQPE
jgi:hypothetical protein